MKVLKLGLIGLSPGNGHPYSWSAIINGYDPAIMETCGFPVIPRYLEKHHFPEDTIDEATVTHVWAQDKKVAMHIAQATFIGTVVGHYEDMIGEVDGVLLARDDAETHYRMALPFLNAGMPIYIDKPLSLSVLSAKRLIDQQQYPGQIFSCSALRYAKELHLSDCELSQIGQLRHIHATVPNDWDKYAIHVIEPLLMLLKERGPIARSRVWRTNGETTLFVDYLHGLKVTINAMGSLNAPISLRLIGDLSWKDLFFVDTFSAFKAALHNFVQGILHKDVRIEPDFMLEAVKILELGRL